MLNEGAEQYIGQQLEVTPFYGWGWDGITDPAQRENERADVPSPFRARLLSLWRFTSADDPHSSHGAFRGGIARVEQPGHPCDAFYAVFSVRHVKPYTFTMPGEHYNIEIGPEEPVFNESGWPQLVAGTPRLYGYAEIRLA
jgi:hypothetical protein